MPRISILVEGDVIEATRQRVSVYVPQCVLHPSSSLPYRGCRMGSSGSNWEAGFDVEDLLVQIFEQLVHPLTGQPVSAPIPTAFTPYVWCDHVARYVELASVSQLRDKGKMKLVHQLVTQQQRRLAGTTAPAQRPSIVTETQHPVTKSTTDVFEEEPPKPEWQRLGPTISDLQRRQRAYFSDRRCGGYPLSKPMSRVPSRQPSEAKNFSRTASSLRFGDDAPSSLCPSVTSETYLLNFTEAESEAAFSFADDAPSYGGSISSAPSFTLSDEDPVQKALEPHKQDRVPAAKGMQKRVSPSPRLTTRRKDFETPAELLHVAEVATNGSSTSTDPHSGIVREDAPATARRSITPPSPTSPTHMGSRRETLAAIQDGMELSATLGATTPGKTLFFDITPPTSKGNKAGFWSHLMDRLTFVLRS